MGYQELSVVIDAEGRVKLEVSGIEGSECETVTKPFEEALGEVESREYTPSYYQSQDVSGNITEAT